MNEWQQERADAVLVARQALEGKGASKGPLTAGGTEVPTVPDLLIVANYIVTGGTPE